jgi:hypothetical protein
LLHLLLLLLLSHLKKYSKLITYKSPPPHLLI